MRTRIAVLVLVFALLAGAAPARTDAVAVAQPGDKLTGQALVDRIRSLAEDARDAGDVEVVGEPWAVQIVPLGRALLTWELRDSGGTFYGTMMSDGTYTIIGIVSQAGGERTWRGWVVNDDGEVLASGSTSTETDPLDDLADDVRETCENTAELGMGLLFTILCRNPICGTVGTVFENPLAKASCKLGTRAHWYSEETAAYPTTSPGLEARPWNDGTYLFDNFIEPLECLPPGTGPVYFGCYTYTFGGMKVPNNPPLGLTYYWPDGDFEQTGVTGSLLRIYPDFRQRTYGTNFGGTAVIRLDVLEDVRGITAPNGSAHAVYFTP